MSTQVDQTQHRAIFFVFDRGTGVGHLRRLACLARTLQGLFACLIVTGHRAAAHWFVPEECEYIHLPSWDSLLECKAQYWGRKPFILVDQNEATELRKGILRGVVEAFAPDVMFVDHHPLGANGELADIVRTTPCIKYYITRGVLNETAGLGEILGGKANAYLKAHYQRAFAALDRRVFNFSRRYNICPAIRRKTIHTGYIVESVSEHVVTRVREERGLESGQMWVVASAGGGQLGEGLIERSVRLATAHKNIVFDVVVGPRSSLPWPGEGLAIARENLHLHRQVFNMPHLHASADLVICSGGYNSLVETLQGNARILCFPNWKDHRDEQYRHAICLKNFVNIDVSTDISELPGLFGRAIQCIGRHQARDRRNELDFNGARRIEDIIVEDLRHR